jgi:CRISPR-associated protein Cas2
MNVVIVTYDICEPGRLRRVYQCLRGWGDHLQYSVFRCVLGRADRERLRAELHGLLDHSVDQVLFFDLGPHDGRARGTVDCLGVAYTHPERHAHVI